MSAIEQAHIALVHHLIRNKKFTRYLINNCYPVGIDGTQKIAFSTLWDEHLLQRRTGPKVDPDSGEVQSYQYYVYVLEASLCFRNGMVIPLMSEFLEYEAGDGEQRKQDCETKAFHRLAARIKKAFPRLPIVLLLDGLYPKGPIMERCRRYHWDFMIVLKDGSLPSVWEEYHSLLHEQQANRMQQSWGERRQRFEWVNAIRYEYGPNAKKAIAIHVVVCRESWEELAPDTSLDACPLGPNASKACGGSGKKFFAKGGRQNTGVVGESSVNPCPEWVDGECDAKKTQLGGRGIGSSLRRTSPTFAPP